MCAEGVAGWTFGERTARALLAKKACFPAVLPAQGSFWRIFDHYPLEAGLCCSVEPRPALVLSAARNEAFLWQKRFHLIPRKAYIPHVGKIAAFWIIKRIFQPRAQHSVTHCKQFPVRIAITKPLFARDCLEDSPSLQTTGRNAAAVQRRLLPGGRARRQAAEVSAPCPGQRAQRLSGSCAVGCGAADAPAAAFVFRGLPGRASPQPGAAAADRHPLAAKGSQEMEHLPVF